MLEPKWVRRDAVIAIHDRQVDLFGGQYGLQEAGLLDSAVSRLKNFFFMERLTLSV
jgi:death on curing protein